ncbi:MAG TPA: sigma 54-interacting transcriptional regulator, partial [candidate division Zixibacteria bacterium]|nr:sigma 54-interacting transcriptional regulator [candidate division Zixibacteria bacterium]
MRELQHKNQDYLQRALELIDSLLSQRKFDQAIQFFADNEFELLGKDSRYSALLRHRRARALSAVSQLPEALKTARRAEVELTRFGETIDLARVYLTLGGVLRDMGELTESERSYRDAESIFRRCDDSVGRGEALNRLAQLKFMQSELPQAIALLVEALELARERDDLRRMAFLYGNLGRVQSFAGSSAKAIDNLRMNIKLSSELGDTVEVVKARLSLGYEFVRLGRFADAAAEFDGLGAPIAENSLQREEALWLIYRAELAVKRGQLALATETLAEAYRLAQRISPTGDLTARVTRGLAELALAEGSFVRALKFAGDAEERFRELGEKIDLGVILHVQAQANHGLNKRAEAVELFERSLDLLDGARAAYELAGALEWAGRVDVFSTHKRLAYLFRAQELQIRRGDEKSRERIDRYIASDTVFALKPSSADSAGVAASASESTAPTVVTANAQMQRILAQLRLIRTTDLPILLTGETGVGKGHIARYYHALVCPDRPFIAINVTNVPETLLESELFGHMKGAYTDAISSATGLLEAANGGVLFLDEIGEMPLKLQMRLLSVIEDKRFRPVGSTEEVDVDFILVTATNR